jgi:dihydroflavonol-4-reductase
VLVLVTGATGFVGSHTASALLDAGHDVRVLARDPAKVAAVPAFAGRDVAVVEGDVTDAAAVRAAVAGCDAVVHAAAQVALDARRAEQTRQVNVEGTKHVVGGALDAGAACVVHVSTVALFGLGRRMVTVDSPLAAGRGPYAQSKLEAETWVRDQQQDGAPVVSVYPGGVHGPDSPSFSEGHRATTVWLRMPPHTEGGTSIVDVRDLARLHVALLERPDRPARVMAGGHYLAWARLVRVLADVTGRRLTPIPMPGPVLRFAGRVGDLAASLVGVETIWSSESMETATRSPRYDSTSADRILGPDGFRPVEETFADEIAWMAGAGHLSARLAGVLAR